MLVIERKRLAHLALVGLLALLDSSNANEPSIDVSLPSGWEVDAKKRFADSGCPFIAGSYRRAGELYLVEVKEAGRRVERKPSSSLIWAGHPRGADNSTLVRVPARTEDRQAGDTFWINQLSTSRFEVCWLDQGGVHINCLMFDQQANDFTCEEGFVLLRVEDTKGFRGSEGVATNVRAQTRIAKGVDGSILYHRKIDLKSKSLFILSSEKTANSFYRFPQVRQR